MSRPLRTEASAASGGSSVEAALGAASAVGSVVVSAASQALQVASERPDVGALFALALLGSAVVGYAAGGGGRGGKGAGDGSAGAGGDGKEGGDAVSTTSSGHTNAVYETSKAVDEYLMLHFGTTAREYFPFKGLDASAFDFPVRCV